MAFAYVQSAFAQDDTSDNSIAVSLTGVGAGSLVVILVKWEGAPATFTISDTTSSATIYGTYNDHGGLGDMSSGFGYYLAANSGSRTYTVTLSGSRPYKWAYALEFSYTGTASLDQVDVSAEGSGDSATSGAITTTGTDEVVIGWLAAYSSGAYVLETIGGSAATGLGTEPSAAHASYRILTATMTGGTAVISPEVAPSWIISALSFKVDAAASGSGDGSATGTGTGTATGSSQASVPVSASGQAVGTLTGSSPATGDASGTGTAVGTLAGSSLNETAMSAAGQGVGTLVPNTRIEAAVSAAGQAVGTFESSSPGTAELSAAGAATAIASSAGSSETAATSTGASVAVAFGVGGTEASGAASAAGQAVGTAVALSPEARFLQAASTFDGSSPGVVTFGSNVTLESALLIAMRIGSDTANVSSITDTAGNTWQPVDITQTQTVDGHQLRVYHVDGAREGATEVTVILDAAVTLRLVAAEYTRVGIEDKSAGTQGSSASPASGSTASTAVREELVVGVVTTQDSSTITAGSGYYKRAEAGGRLALSDKTVANIGTFNADWTLGASDEWAAVTVTYMASSPTLNATGQATAVAVAGGTYVQSEGYSRASSAYVVMEWEASVDADGYEIGYDTDSGDPYTNLVDVGDVLTYTVGPLAAGTWYLSVRAYNEGGDSDWATETVANISRIAVASPDAQTAVDASATASSTVTAVGRSNASVEFGVTGVATAEAVSSQESYGTSNAVATGEAEGTSQAAVPAYAAGSSTAQSTAESQASAEISATGAATAGMTGASTTGSETLANSSGSSTVTAEGISLFAADVVCAGTSDAQAELTATITAAASSAGIAIAQADSGIEIESVRRGSRPKHDDDEELMMLLEDYIFPFVLGPPEGKEIVIYDV